MSDNSEYYTIAAIARTVANDIGMYSPHMYFQFEAWAMDGFREASFDFAGTGVEHCMLPMNSLRIVELPKDYVDWIEFGIKRGERVLIIGQAGDLIEYNVTDDCGVETPNSAHPPLDIQPTGTNLMPYIPFGRTVPYNTDLIAGAGSYEGGLPNRGFFNVEGKYPNFRVRFGSELSTRDQIYLKYVTDGLRPCGNTFVHPYIVDYLRKYTHYRRTEHRDDTPQITKDRNESRMLAARKEAIMRVKGIAPIDLINSARRGFKLTTKV